MGELRDCLPQSPVGVTVATEMLLDGSTAGIELDPQGGGVGRHEIECLEECSPALLEPADPRLRSSQLHEHVEANGSLSRRLGHEPERRLVPAGGRGRGPA